MEELKLEQRALKAKAFTLVCVIETQFMKKFLADEDTDSEDNQRASSLRTKRRTGMFCFGNTSSLTVKVKTHEEKQGTVKLCKV